MKNTTMKIGSRFTTTLRVMLLLALFAAGIVAQTATATLSGTVTDEKDAVIPGAAITIVNNGTGARRNATTNNDGAFTLPLLPPSQYTLTVQREGFTTVQVPDIVLNVGDQKALQVMLKVGDVNAAIEVRPDASLVSTSPAVGTVVDRTFVGNLPLNGRSFQSLILLTPGVVLTTVGFGFNTPGQFSVNGQRSNANNFTVDGVSANVGIGSNTVGANFSQYAAGSLPGFTAFGTTTSLVSIDALEEFKIQTSTYTAEFGRQPGGQVQFVTRSGGNKFHGTAFEYLRNEVFDANNWFSNRAGRKRAPLRQNQFGGTFSGPVFLPRFGDGGPSLYKGKDRTFFFFSYEGTRLRQPVIFNILVPSIRLRQLAPPVVRTLLNIISLPTGPETTTSTGAFTGMARFEGSGSGPSKGDATSIRIDHALNSKLTIFGRYNEAPSSNVSRILSALTATTSRTRTVTLGSTQLISPQLNNEFRFNYTSNRGTRASTMDNFGGAIPVDSSVLPSGYTGPGPTWGQFFVQFAGGGAEVDLGDLVDSYQRQINIVDNVSVVRGAHGLKFGFDYRRLAPIFGPVPYSQGVFFFSQSHVLNGITSLLIVRAGQGSRPIFKNFSAYAQDTWKVSRRLTLDWGLRWDLNPPPHDANGLTPVLVTGVENLPTATLAPSNSPFYKTDYTAFAPRFGIAYQLRQAQGRETVLRGGFGVYYDLGSGQAVRTFTGFPFNNFRLAFGVQMPFSPALVAPPAFPPVTLPITNELMALNPHLRLPYTLHWNVALQQSLGANQTVSLSYVASAGRQLLTTQRLNVPVGSPAVRPNPNFADIFYTTNSPTSDYHSMQTQYQRRLSHGLQAVVNYTWSHAIDEVSDEANFGTLARGNADFDVRHNFTTGITYDLPVLKAGKIVRMLLRDWSLDSTIYARSGQPLNLRAGQIFLPDGTHVSVRPDLILGVPIWLKDSSKPGGQRINSAAFRPPPFVTGSTSVYARQGTLGRNVVRTPFGYQVNLGLRRQFKFSERGSLQLKAEAFNLFNHPLFGQYETDIRSSSFGESFSTLNVSTGGLSSLYQFGGPRSLQFSVRLGF